MPNAFNNRVFEPGMDNPAVDHIALTFHDSNNETVAFRAVWANSAGTITIVSAAGNAVQYTVAAAGLIPVSGIRVNSTGTSVTSANGLL